MERQGNKKKKFLIALCLIAPAVAIVMLILTRSGSVNLGSYLPYALFLLCPLSHFLLMPLMHKGMDTGQGSVEKNGKKPSCH